VADVTVQSTPSTTAPSTVQQTRVISVRLLVNASGKGVPAFNQGLYTDELPVQVPEKDAQGNPIPDEDRGTRTIQTSGCGLCAWASFLAAAGCCAPVYNASSKTFSAGTSPIDPSSLLKYFINYLKTKPGAKIWAAYNNGVMQADSPDVRAAVNQLVALNSPGGAEFDNTVSNDLNVAPGTEVEVGVSSFLEQGNPVVLAVHSGKLGHQVLAVGIAKILDKTYYVINDSGFGLHDPFPTLQKAGTTIDAKTLGPCLATLTRNPGKSGPWGYQNISAARVMLGLQTITGLTLKPPPY